MKVFECEQGSPEWKLARAGKVTASRVVDAMAKAKAGEASSRRELKTQLVVETLTGIPAESGFINDAMRHGKETEPFARAAYEAHNHCMVDQVGLVIHPSIARGAASPDGLVDDDGMVETKCPNTSTHIGYLMDGRIPSKYKIQMSWQMACTGRAWCDFVSYDPRLPDHLQLLVVRFYRDDTYISELEAEVIALLAEVDGIIAKLPRAPEK